MDIIVIVVGLAIAFFGIKKFLGEKEKKSNSSIILSLVGGAIALFGIIWFSSAFITSFNETYNEINKQAPSQPTAIPQTETGANSYPQTTVDAYIRTCVETFDLAPFDIATTYCECTINTMQYLIPYDEYLELDQEFADTDVMPRKINSIIDACIEEHVR